MYIIRLIIILLLLPTDTLAKSRDYYFNISYNSLLYTHIDNPNYEYVNKYEQITNPFKDSLKSFGVGVSREIYDKWTVNFTTNRLYSKETKRTVKHKGSGTTLIMRSRIKSDTLQLGKRFNGFLPMLFISNVEFDNSLWNNHYYLNREIHHTFLYGLNFNYFINKHLSSSIYCILPNAELRLDSGCGLVTSYNF